MTESGQLDLSYPEIMPGATAWVWSDEPRMSAGVMPVSERGLRHVLRMIADMQQLLVDGLVEAMAQKPEEEQDCVRLPFKSVSKLIARSGQVWTEGDLVASGLFVGKDNQPILSRSPEVELLGSEPLRISDAAPDPKEPEGE